jgi:predicted metalloprotease with PDZ domain
VHASLRVQPGARGDWIVEGVAELYSLEMLRRSKTLSKRRYDRSLARLAERGSAVTDLEVPRSTGDVTARAVTVLHALDLEIRQATAGAAGLDGVVARLAEQGGEVDAARLRLLSEQVAGASLERFFARSVPSAAKPGASARAAGARSEPQASELGEDDPARP